MIGGQVYIGPVGAPPDRLRPLTGVWADGFTLPRFPEPDCQCADLLRRTADYCPAHPRARITHPRGTRTP